MPYPESADEFPTAHQVREYLDSYADRFDLRPHMRFSTEVVSVSRLHNASDGSPGRFRVTTQTEGASPEVRAYDYVVVCNGVFSEPHVPHFNGQERFDGPILHSSEVTDRKQLEDRRVVIIGGGKSAYDLAEAAAEHAASCTLVFRSAHWLAPRYLMGLRGDWLVLTRFAQALLPYHTKRGAAALLHRFGKPLVTFYWWFMTELLRRLEDIPDDHAAPRLITSSTVRPFSSTPGRRKGYSTAAAGPSTEPSGVGQNLHDHPLVGANYRALGPVTLGTVERPWNLLRHAQRASEPVLRPCAHRLEQPLTRR